MVTDNSTKQPTARMRIKYGVFQILREEMAVRLGPKADIHETGSRRSLRKSETLIFFSASKTLCALANHRRSYEFFERDVPIRMGHCRRLE
jgi:hypothetical protein